MVQERGPFFIGGLEPGKRPKKRVKRVRKSTLFATQRAVVDVKGPVPKGEYLHSA